jgi:HAD superfamily phosphoserine phosphatase-like hydrolase
VVNHHKRCLALVLDWDGTVTEVDTLHMINERFGDPEVFGALEDELGRTLTLDEAIAREIATVTAPLEEVVDYLRSEVRVRPGFRELVSEYDPLIVSAGFHELIEPILEREGVAARVVANSVVADPAGWRAVFRERPLCEVCGEPCKRGAVADLGRFAYVGDGISDLCVSLVAERRFARRSLALWLDERGVPYERFDDLHDVARALAAMGTGQ